MAVAESASPISLTQEKVRTPLTDAWYQFRKKYSAVLALIFIIGLIFTALTADVWRQVGFIDDPNFQHEAPRGSNVNMAYSPPLTCSLDVHRQDPQWCFAFGTDGLRRDMLSRIVYGARVSLAVGFFGTAVSMTFGIVYGIIAGYYGGRIDNLMMRFIDFMYSIPNLPLIIVLQTVFKSLSDYKDTSGPVIKALVDIDNGMGGLFFLFIVIGLLSWIGVARLARGQVLAYKNKEFVEAARAIGASDRHIIFAHLLPNIIGPLVIVICGAVPGFIGTEAALSYLGIGINPPLASWGAMISEVERVRFGYPHIVIFAGGTLTLTVWAFNLLADGLRDALDPSLRGT